MWDMWDACPVISSVPPTCRPIGLIWNEITTLNMNLSLKLIFKLNWNSKPSGNRIWNWILFQLKFESKFEIRFEIELNLNVKLNLFLKPNLKLKSSLNLNWNLGLNFNMKLNLIEFKLNLNLSLNLSLKSSLIPKWTLNLDLSSKLQLKLNFYFYLKLNFNLNSIRIQHITFNLWKGKLKFKTVYYALKKVFWIIYFHTGDPCVSPLKSNTGPRLSLSILQLKKIEKHVNTKIKSDS